MGKSAKARAAERLTATDPVEILQLPTTGRTIKRKPAKESADQRRDDAPTVD
jgi:hypothetical protein